MFSMRGLIERAGDFYLGIHTRAPYTEDAALSPEGIGYAPVPYPTLLSMLRSVPASLRSRPLVDFGCGKGRVLAAAERLGFQHVIGVEISGNLAMEAINNAARGAYRFQVDNVDATMYRLPDNVGTCVLVNPFNGSLLRSVLGNIAGTFKYCGEDNRLIAHNNMRKVTTCANELGITLNCQASGHGLYAADGWAAYSVL